MSQKWQLDILLNINMTYHGVFLFQQHEGLKRWTFSNNLNKTVSFNIIDNFEKKINSILHLDSSILNLMA